MGLLRIDAACASIRTPSRFTPVPAMLVDTGSEFSWIPEELLRAVGIRPVKKDQLFTLANGETIRRSLGFAILRAAEFETVDEVVFGQPGDLALLGVRTLSGFGARVDLHARCLVPSGPHPAAIGLRCA